MNKNVCAVNGCSAQGRIYIIPKELKSKWCENLKADPETFNPVINICFRHFPNCCIEGLTIKHGSVPTLNLGHSEGPIHKNTMHTPNLEPTISKRCLVKGCPSKYNLFEIPQKYKMEWCVNLRINPAELNPASKVCGRHFSASSIWKQKLKDGAMPTLNLGHNDNATYTEVKAKEKLITGTKKAPLYTSKRCVVAGCPGVRQRVGIPFRYRKEWCANLKLDMEQLTKTPNVCLRHFQSSCFRNNSLINGSMPTINLGHNDGPIYTGITEDILKNKKKTSRPDLLYRLIHSTDESEQFKCVINGCSRKRLFSIPPTRAKNWSKVLNLSMDYFNSRTRVCNRHFFTPELVIARKDNSKYKEMIANGIRKNIENLRSEAIQKSEKILGSPVTVSFDKKYNPSNSLANQSTDFKNFSTDPSVDEPIKDTSDSCELDEEENSLQEVTLGSVQKPVKIKSTSALTDARSLSVDDCIESPISVVSTCSKFQRSVRNSETESETETSFHNKRKQTQESLSKLDTAKLDDKKFKSDSTALDEKPMDTIGATKAFGSAAKKSEIDPLEIPADETLTKRVSSNACGVKEDVSTQNENASIKQSAKDFVSDTGVNVLSSVILKPRIIQLDPKMKLKCCQSKLNAIPKTSPMPMDEDINMADHKKKDIFRADNTNETNILCNEQKKISPISTENHFVGKQTIYPNEETLRELLELEKKLLLEPKEKCIAKGCRGGKQLYRIPRRKATMWCANLQINVNKVDFDRDKVCDRHFPKSCFGKKDGRILRHAIPQLELGHNKGIVYTWSFWYRKLEINPNLSAEEKAAAQRLYESSDSCLLRHEEENISLASPSPTIDVEDRLSDNIRSPFSSKQQDTLPQFEIENPLKYPEMYAFWDSIIKTLPPLAVREVRFDVTALLQEIYYKYKQ